MYFTALLRKFLRICKTFPSSDCIASMPEGVSNMKRNRVLIHNGSNRPLQGLEEVFNLEQPDSEHGLSRFDLGKVERVIDQSRQSLGGLPDELNLFFLFGRQLAVRTSESRNPVRLLIELSGERSSWLISERKRDLRSDKRFRIFVCLVKLSIQSHDAPVGLIELA